VTYRDQQRIVDIIAAIGAIRAHLPELEQAVRRLQT